LLFHVNQIKYFSLYKPFDIAFDLAFETYFSYITKLVMLLQHHKVESETGEWQSRRLYFTARCQ